MLGAPLLLAGVAAPSSLLAGLVSFYRMEGSAADSVGTYNGSTFGAVSFAAGSAKTGSSGALFAGGGIDLGATPLFHSYAVSFACWFSLTVPVGSGFYALTDYGVGPYNSGRHDFRIYTNPTGTISVFTIYPTGITVAFPGTGWHHFAFTRNAALYGRVYVDGTKVGEGATGTNGPPPAVGSTHCWLGYLADGFPFYGSIDDAGYWNRELSASEIASLYNGGAGLSYPF